MVQANTNKQIHAPTTIDVLRALKQDINFGLNAINIGIIQSFDAANQSVTIQLALKTVVSESPDGTRTLQERPLILECPAVILSGGGAYVGLPIQAGDNCIVMFNDREIDNWFQNGGIQTPTTYRTHDISDAFALVGIRNMTTALANYLTDGVRLFFNATSKIDITNDLIDSIAALFKHHGDMEITGNLLVRGDFTILGDTFGDGSNNINLRANLIQAPGFEIHDGRQVSGTFEVIEAEDGIVVGGS